MIIKKLWNSFNDSTRSHILELLGYHCTGIYAKLCQSYNHDFNHDIVGKALKEVLASCALQNDGSIKVSVMVEPSFVVVEHHTSSSQKTQHIAAVVHHVHKETVAHCEYCGKPLSRSDVNDYGSLCERCYMKEYYGKDDVY